MQKAFLVVPAVILAGCATTQAEVRPNPRDPQVQVAPVQYRSAFENYRAFADQDLADWRKANEDVGAAGGHAGHRPAQGRGEQSSKPQPGKPESSGGAAEPKGHGDHK